MCRESWRSTVRGKTFGGGDTSCPILRGEVGTRKKGKGDKTNWISLVYGTGGGHARALLLKKKEGKGSSLGGRLRIHPEK